MAPISYKIIMYYAELQGLAEEDVRRRMDALEVMNHEMWLMMVKAAEDAIDKAKRADAFEDKVGELSRELQRKDDAIATLNMQIAIRDNTIAEKNERIEELKANEQSVWESKMEVQKEFQELRELQAEVAPKAKKNTMSINALLVEIGRVASEIGSLTKERLENCFNEGYSTAWMEDFWTEVHEHPDWMMWLTDATGLKCKQYMMVMGKLMKLKVFKHDAPKLSRCFSFKKKTAETVARYLNLGVNEFASIHPAMNVWIEQYVASHPV